MVAFILWFIKHRQLTANHADIPRGVDSDADGLPLDPNDGDRDVVAVFERVLLDQLAVDVALTRAQLEEIATTKMPDLTAADMDAAVRTIAGSARSAGIETEGVV